MQQPSATAHIHPYYWTMNVYRQPNKMPCRLVSSPSFRRLSCANDTTWHRDSLDAFSMSSPRASWPHRLKRKQSGIIVSLALSFFRLGSLLLLQASTLAADSFNTAPIPQAALYEPRTSPNIRSNRSRSSHRLDLSASSMLAFTTIQASPLALCWHVPRKVRSAIARDVIIPPSQELRLSILSPTPEALCRSLSCWHYSVAS